VRIRDGVGDVGGGGLQSVWCEKWEMVSIHYFRMVGG